MKNEKLFSQKKTSAVITAAGKSERMGFFKPFLIFDKEKKITFLEEIVNKYEKIKCEKIVVILNKNSFEYYKNKKFSFLDNHKILINNHLEYERFYSVKLGMQNVTENNFVFLQATDNPFLEISLLEKLIEKKNSDGCTIPSYNKKGGHPILISPKIVKYIVQKSPEDSNLKIVLQNFKRKYIDCQNKNILLNINTPEEYNNLFLNK